MVPSAERQAPPDSDPAPAVILLPREGVVKGRVNGADDDRGSGLIDPAAGRVLRNAAR